ncbi:hypothetical protein AR457_35915 [Streptomyces agglomeratus]|nr:transposase [Streptomyces agglomeratus]OEJ22687.1 hypothetical protein AR457_35915 [Streptomyces agglomeratus]
MGAGADRGRLVYAVNPRQAARFKERYATSGAKSDRGDAHALADMVRIDRDQLRPIAGDSGQAQAVRDKPKSVSPPFGVERDAEAHDPPAC